MLATQAYLAITALLILLVNTLRSARAQSLERAEQWRGRFELALAGSHQLMYRYNPQDGSLELAGDVQAALGAPADAMRDLDALLARAHPDDRSRLSRWAARRAGTQDMTPLLFRLAHGAGGWRLISDKDRRWPISMAASPWWPACGGSARWSREQAMSADTDTGVLLIHGLGGTQYDLGPCTRSSGAPAWRPMP